MYGLIGKFTAVAGRRDALAAILLDATTAMPDCLSYVVANDPGDPDALWVTEVWDSAESHRASLKLPAVQAAIAKGRPLIAAVGERTETAPLGGVGLSVRAEAHPAWEDEIRRAEEEVRDAFLAADIGTLERFWAEDFHVNSPLNQLAEKSQVIALLQAGRIRHTAFEYVIERMSRHGDMVVVMGRERVADPPDGTVVLRRFTNLWRLEHGRWRTVARHAHVVSREVPAAAP
jgi:quinol monooxygenase YgiN/ketosteroid isomerase-like protein